VTEMDIQEVLRYLPHRFPFLLIDRVRSCEPGKRLVAIKNVTANEPHFAGHFPEWPIMPGVLILEAMAQAAAILGFRTMQRMPDKEEMYYFAGIDSARFKKPVLPGDQLELEVELVASRRGIGKYECKARVDGALVTEAVLLCALRPVAARP
jgi:3-hydroxyacyl-[acyl-carrier-protein] dehydratase